MNKNLIAFAFVVALFQNAFAQKKPKLIFIETLVYNQDSMIIEQFEVNYSPIVFPPKKALLFDNQGLPKNTSFNFLVASVGYFSSSFELKTWSDTTIKIYLKENTLEFTSLMIKATQAKENSGFVFSKINKQELAAKNFGQDFTYLIGNTASAYSTSDAGAGVGYTGIRIRGSDGTRINVNINGVPINDQESHGVFWVNMPDLASGTSGVQIQRGVGSSSNGSGAFGANISISNIELSKKPFLVFNQTLGSFNTQKTSLQFGTGKINNFSFGGRISRIKSDGYIDRASSNLSAFQFNMDYSYKKYNMQFVTFGGTEKTYQSWFGTPESRFKNDVQGMNDYADRNGLTGDERSNLLNSGRTYNYYTYPNQTDNYAQNHYQMHHNFLLSKYVKLKSSFFLTTGKGFYEEYKERAKFSSYGVANFTTDNDTFTRTNLVRQRWLDNVFYGNFTSMNYKKNRLELDFGLLFSQYDGKHFGEIIWADLAQAFGKDFRYYNSKSKKTEINGFAKANYQMNRKLSVGAEIQVRQINYNAQGTDNNLSIINVNESFLFLNPKASLVYEASKKLKYYSSFSVGNREPVRSDFIDNQNLSTPKPENLKNLEAGAIYNTKKVFAQANFYEMNYKNQLVLTGELNDVGSSLRRNVASSYRRGIEFLGKYKPNNNMTFEGNYSISSNKIKNYTDFYDHYYSANDSTAQIATNFSNTHIALSPQSVLFLSYTDQHIKNLSIGLSFKRVGLQYLDNSSNKNNALPAFSSFDFNLAKKIQIKNIESFTIKAQVNNIFNQSFANNGYSYQYGFDGQVVQERFYYPQALRYWFLGIEIRI